MRLIKTILANIPKNRWHHLLFSGLLFLLYFFPVGLILSLKSKPEPGDTTFVDLSEY